MQLDVNAVEQVFHLHANKIKCLILYDIDGVFFVVVFKTVTIARDVENEKGMESETFPTPSRTTTNLALLRYDTNHTYYARG